MAEKYPDFSPYAVCGNNTLRIIDPSGKIWVDITQPRDIENDINAKKTEYNMRVEEKRAKLEENTSEKESKKLNSEIKELNFMIGLLDKGLEMIKQLGDDPDHKYVIRTIGTDKNSNVSQGESDGRIYINATTPAVALHEITHISQSLDAGGLTFTGGLLNNAGRTLGQAINNEVEAYRMQFSLDGSFPSYPKPLHVYEINGISISNLQIEGKKTYDYMKKAF